MHVSTHSLHLCCSSVAPDDCTESCILTVRTDIDIRQTNITRLLEAHPDAKQNVATVSLGDEISIKGKGNTSDFQAWCRTQSPPLTPKDLGCSGWADCPLSSSFLNVTKTPALYYYSMKFLHSSGIAAMKTKVQGMQKQLTKALFGANFSPTAYFVDPFTGKQKCQNYIGYRYHQATSTHALVTTCYLLRLTRGLS